MKSFFEEFKAFAMKGNVMELAVAVVIGGAFGKIVSSLVNNIITPLLGLLLGGIDMSSISYTVGKESVTYGVFMQSIIDFIIISFVIFLAVKGLNSLQRKENAKPEEEKAVEPSEEILLLREIRDALKNK